MMIKKNRLFIIIIAMNMVMCFNAYALFDNKEKEEVPVIVNGDTVEYFADLGKVVAQGDVVVEYSDTTLTCDKIVVYTDSKDGFAEGNVVLKDEGGLVRGERLEYNFQTQEGNFFDVDFRMAPYFCVSPEAKKGPTKIILRNADMTTCNLDKPHYHMHASEVEIYPQEKIFAKNVTFIVGKVPIIYLPFFVQHLDDKQHGFSFEPGQSREWGTYLLTAYRYYLNEEYRGIARMDYRANKGFAYGIDLEKFTGEYGTGYLRYYFIKEDLHGRGEVSPLYKRPERYRIEFLYNWDIDEDTQLVSEVYDYSDRYLLRDYFERQYEINPTPRSYVLLSRNYANATLSLLMQKRFNHFFTVTEKLPELKLETRKFKLMESPFYYEHESSLVNFTLRNADTAIDEDVARADTFNQVSYPCKLAFFNLEPSVGMRNSFYSKDKNGSEHLFRSIFYSGASVLTKFYKTFNDIKVDSFWLEIDNLRHIITPSLDYEYINEPTLSGERLTAFDAVDSIAKKNQITLSLENKLQTKRAGESVDFLRFIVSSPYQFKLEGYGGRFGDISMDLELLPNRWLTFNSEAEFDPHRRAFRTANFDVTIPFDDEKGKITAGYRYAAGEVDSKVMTFVFERLLNPKWQFRSYHRLDFVKDSIIEEQEYALVRDLHCWELEVHC